MQAHQLLAQRFQAAHGHRPFGPAHLAQLAPISRLGFIRNEPMVGRPGFILAKHVYPIHAGTGGFISGGKIALGQAGQFAQDAVDRRIAGHFFQTK